MENLKKKLESGAEIEVTLASFPEGHRLFKVVAKELQGLDLAIGTVQNLALKLISSEEIEAALWPCMARGVYNNSQKIVPSLFEDPAIRCDFLEIAKEVMVFNLTPFSKNVGLLSSAMFRKDIDTLK